MKNICLLWDFDGTLAYRDGMWTQSLICVLERNGYQGMDYALISKTMLPHYPWEKHELAHTEYFNGLGWWEYIEKHVVGEALRAVGITGKENERIASQFKEEYLSLGAWFLFEDTHRNLERAREEGYACAVLSNHTPELYMLADYLGISHFFKEIITSADIGYEKPNAKFFDATKSLGAYDGFIMIGDNYEADIQGAGDYGIKAVMVRKPNTENYPLYSENLDGIWQFINKRQI